VCTEKIESTAPSQLLLMERPGLGGNGRLIFLRFLEIVLIPENGCLLSAEDLQVPCRVSSAIIMERTASVVNMCPHGVTIRQVLCLTLDDQI
jgi:hypothetical protein